MHFLISFYPILPESKNIFGPNDISSSYSIAMTMESVMSIRFARFNHYNCEKAYIKINSVRYQNLVMYDIRKNRCFSSCQLSKGKSMESKSI